MSLPSLGAWIEMTLTGIVKANRTSLPSRGAWIEMSPAKLSIKPTMSLPLRGAWIEIFGAENDAAGHRGRALYGERGLKHYFPTDEVFV